MRKLTLVLVALALLPGTGCDKAVPTAPEGATITVTVNPTKIDIDGEAIVTALLRKSDGRPVNPGTVVFFATTLGEIDTSVPTDDAGVAEAKLKGDGRVGEASITVSSGAAPDVTGTSVVQIGSLAESAVITPTPSNVDFNNIPQGGAKISLLAEVFGDNGQGLADVAVIFGTETGRLQSRGASIQTDANGQATDVLTVNQNDLSVVGDTFFLVDVLVPTDGSGTTGGIELTAEAEIDIFGVASRIELQATPTTVSTSGDIVQLSALVVDEGSNPIEGAGVNFLTDLGNLSSGGAVVRTGADGRAVDTLEVRQEDVGTISTPTFQVKAQTSDFTGGLIESTFDIRIQGDAPRAFFSWAAKPAPESNVVVFSNESTGAATLTYLWTFGDGGTSADRSPEHTYNVTTQTTFTVTLVVTNDFGSDTFTDQVTVSPSGGGGNAPVAGFNWAADAVVSLKVDFTNTSTGSAPLTYLWDFGDGSTSTVRSPSHTYDAPVQTYTVKLTVTNTEGSDSSTQSVTPSSVGGNAPVAGFTWAPDAVTSLEVDFTDTSTGSAPLTYLWDFGDGQTSTDTSPSHLYSGVGPYTVELTVTNTEGSDSSTQSVTPTTIP